jgi:pimeloyl-ACP methyl ester carboxylesterase
MMPNLNAMMPNYLQLMPVKRLNTGVFSLFSALIFTSSVCYAAQSIPGTLCTVKGSDIQATCGSVSVVENAAQPNGRKLDIHYLVVPARADRKLPDPIFFFAGGPGQSATKFAGFSNALFGKASRRRDVVFIDQRGTGKSNGLQCANGPSIMESLSPALARDGKKKLLDDIDNCIKALEKKADLTQYISTIAMADIDAVRAHLGVEQVNLYGASYGTRAALEYMRLYPTRVRTAVLDGVAPATIGMPLSFVEDAKAAFSLVAAQCTADATCTTNVQQFLPGKSFSEAVIALAAKWDATPIKTTLAHPHTGVMLPVEVTGDVLLSTMFTSLYVPNMASMLPAIVAQAQRDNVAPLLALLTSFHTGVTENMFDGMRYSVVCSEDAPRATADLVTAKQGIAPFGKVLTESFLEACKRWPKASVDDAFYAPLKSATPVLLLSGGSDPVTPPRHAQSIMAGLPNAKHLIATHLGHGVAHQGCGPDLLDQFYAAGNADKLDGACLNKLPRPLLFTAAKPKNVKSAGDAK